MLSPPAFSTRIALYFGALFLSAMGAVVLLWYVGWPALELQGEREQRLMEATRILEYAANQQVASINTIIRERRGDVLILSENKPLTDSLKKRDGVAVQKNMTRIFERLQRAYPDVYQGMRVVDPRSARIVASVAHQEIGQVFPRPDLMARITQAGTTELLEDESDGHGQILTLVRQMIELDDEGYPTGDLQGILLITMRLVQIADANTRAGYEQPGASLVFSKTADSPASTAVESTDKTAFLRRNQVATGFEGVLHLPDANGDMYVAVYRHIQLSGAKGWTLVHYQAEQEALRELNQQVHSVVMAGFGIAIAALLLIFMSARHLTQPLRRLTDAAHRLGTGDVSARSESARGDSREFADLSLAFNTMASSIEQTQLMLEAKVLARTAALLANEERLEHIAHYDALTHLPNRVLLADRLHQSMAQCQRLTQSLAVAFLDLDGFKAVNDQHGHTVGDGLLMALAKRMQAALREGDTLARIGGDEFVAVLVGMESPDHCVPVLERLLEAAAGVVEVGELQLQVSASIGVTLYPQDNAEADLLLRHADQAMYLAKQAGKNRYHLFDIAHETAAKNKGETLKHIRRAIDRHEFVLYYQPKVNMQTGAVIGAEALIRWQHPERGLLPPGAFLPAIEDHPISVDLGDWVIATALQQMSTWQAAGFELSVSVNIGARQLQHAGFTAQLGELLAANPSIAPCRLELEILETCALEDMARVCEVMRACQSLGVRFALDDFGTGYSSLTYLKQLPAELLKIDQSFVRDMLTDPDDLAIVQGVIGLAKAFRREVIAEGVETTAHGELLLSMGCELAQGYGIARPMPAADLPGWVANWRPKG